MIEKITLWVCDKCDARPASFCRECFKCGKLMQPAEFVRDHAAKPAQTRAVRWRLSPTRKNTE